MLNDKFCRFQCGLLFDPWAQPLVMMKETSIHMERPVIAILSEEFSFWPDNYESVQELIDNSVYSNKSLCLSLNGTAHQHQSDVLVSLVKKKYNNTHYLTFTNSWYFDIGLYSIFDLLSKLIQLEPLI